MDQRLFEALSRRRFLGQSLAGAGLAALGPRALTAGTAGTFGAPATQPFLVVVNLRGGNDGLNTVVPVQEQEYYDQRPDLATLAEFARSRNRELIRAQASAAPPCQMPVGGM